MLMSSKKLLHKVIGASIVVGALTVTLAACGGGGASDASPERERHQAPTAATVARRCLCRKKRATVAPAMPLQKRERHQAPTARNLLLRGGWPTRRLRSSRPRRSATTSSATTTGRTREDDGFLGRRRKLLGCDHDVHKSGTSTVITFPNVSRGWSQNGTIVQQLSTPEKLDDQERDGRQGDRPHQSPSALGVQCADSHGLALVGADEHLFVNQPTRTTRSSRPSSTS